MKKNYLTIRKNREFQRLYKRGHSAVNSLLVTYLTRTHRTCNRIGITATKKVGGAVERNRARRVVRAAYAELMPQLPAGGLDIVFVCRGRTAKVKMQEVRRQMTKQLRQLGVLPQPEGPRHDG